MEKKSIIYKNIKCYWYKNQLGYITQKFVKSFVDLLFENYPNYFKTVKELDLTVSKGLTDRANNNFLIDKKECTWLEEGLIVNNILINDQKYKEQEKPKVVIKKNLNRKNQIIKAEELNIQTFVYDNIEVKWVDYFKEGNKYFVVEFIHNLNKFYPKLFKNILKMDFTNYKDWGNEVIVDNKKFRFMFIDRKPNLFIENKLYKEPEDKTNKTQIIKVKSNLRKINKKQLGYIDCTVAFKHKNPYLYSLLSICFNNQFKVYNLESNSFCLYTKINYDKNLNKEYVIELTKELNKYKQNIIKTEFKGDMLYSVFVSYYKEINNE